MMEHRPRRLPATRQLWLGIAFVNLSIVFAAVAGAAEPQKPIRIVTFGDSLTAGFNLAQKDAFPVQLERALAAKGHAVEVINASVSGDTTAAALVRFDWAVPEDRDRSWRCPHLPPTYPAARRSPPVLDVRCARGEKRAS